MHFVYYLQVSSLLRDGQREIHPSLRKLLGKKTVDLEEIFKIREPRNKSRKDYSVTVFFLLYNFMNMNIYMVLFKNLSDKLIELSL